MSNGHIFISYRRDDSAGYTRAIYDQLAERFTQERIFMDVDAIEPGLPFDEVITQAVSRCEILIAMIGKHWMEQQPNVGPRINDENDFVRLEIAAALSRNIRVIPVLLDGAGMPSEELLPEPLRALARRNAIEISGGTRFRSDVDRLVEAVSKALGESNVPSSQEPSRPHRIAQYWVLGGLTAIAIFSSSAYFYLSTKNVSQPDNGRLPHYTSVPKKPVPPPNTNNETGSDLCKELDGKSINFIGNHYKGIVGPMGIKLVEIELGKYKFDTEVVFSDNDVIQKFGGPLRDPIAGLCVGGTIKLDRTLRDGKTIHSHVGSISKADTGRIEMRGTFENGASDWNGWIDTQARK